jgi:citrate synthase
MSINSKTKISPTTSLCDQNETQIFVRGRDLVNELIGVHSFTEVFYFLTCGKLPTKPQTQILDACLVTLMEHGINPSSIVARLISSTNPNEPQVAIAAGLMAIGGKFGGTAEQSAIVLTDLAELISTSGESAILQTAQRLISSGAPIAGFGHLHHKPDDPRSPRLIAIAESTGIPLPYTTLLKKLSIEIDAVKGRHLTINATGAIGALLLDIGIPMSAIRSVAVVSRSAGLAGHLVEELNKPAALTIWRASRASVPFSSD